MKKALALLLLVAMITVVVVAQEATKPPSEPGPKLTEMQKLRVLSAFQRAVIAQNNFQISQQQAQTSLAEFNASYKAYNETCVALVEELKVGAGWTCNVDSSKQSVELVKVPSPQVVPDGAKNPEPSKTPAKK